MPHPFSPVEYSKLNARQKESYNYQKLSALLADYGFVTMRLSDDWNGADFIAQHLSGETLLVQLKPRLGLYQKYLGKGLWVAFPEEKNWFLFPHDSVLGTILSSTNVASTESWSLKGEYHWPTLPTEIRRMLEPYQLSAPHTST